MDRGVRGVTGPTLGPQRLFAKDVASQFGISHRSARRWLSELERTHGPQVVGRVGSGPRNSQRFTTRAALARVQPVSGPPPMELHDRVGWLEDELRQVRQLASDLLRRVTRLER